METWLIWRAVGTIIRCVKGLWARPHNSWLCWWAGYQLQFDDQWFFTTLEHEGVSFLRFTKSCLSRERQLNMTRGASPTTWEQSTMSTMLYRARPPHSDANTWGVPRWLFIALISVFNCFASISIRCLSNIRQDVPIHHRSSTCTSDSSTASISI